MRLSAGENPAGFVSLSGSEELLAAIARQTANPRAGIFGPDSASWKINRESALFLGAGRAALLQLAHPWVAQALADHSTLLSKPIARFHNTFRVVFTMIFGSLEQALAASRHLGELHERIQGEMPADVAGWKRGTRYAANEVAALRWVFATLVESAVLAYECVLPPLTPSEREAYYAESKTLAGLFGIPAGALPGDWPSFRSFIDQMCASDSLGVGPAARGMARSLLTGAGSWIRPPHWYRALTAQWMPARFRQEFALDFRAADRRAAEGARRWLPAVYHRLPSPVRFAGPWHEAAARLDGRSPGILVRASNCFWIGEPRLPFGG